MSKLFVSVFENTAEQAIERIASLDDRVDGVELRVDAFSAPGAELPLDRFRAATTKELMYTRRARAKNERATADELFAAAAAGFDVVDVEVAIDHDSVDLGWIPGVQSFLGSWGEKILFSFHDWEGVPEFLEQIVDQLEPFEFKLALTPRSFEENLRLLRALSRARGRAGTIFGMGARGLYSRILAPFFGSELMFVAADEKSAAAPGQLTLDDALAIYGDAKTVARPEAIFAVIGNPAAHSRSPRIHNPIFRKRGASAAYAVIDTDDFDDVAERVARGDELAPRGLSITAPFKEEAYRFAVSRGATLSPAAARARAVNTLVRMADGSMQAANTDVEGFVTLLRGPARRQPAAVVLGSGGTARAALVALEQLGIPATVASRNRSTGEALANEFGARYSELSGIASLAADFVIDTIPAAAGFEVPDPLVYGATLITADYSATRAHTARHHIGGLALLEAQAAAQSELFLASMHRRAGL